MIKALTALLFIIASVAYFAAFVLYSRTFLRETETAQKSAIKTSRGFLLSAVIVHSFYVIVLSIVRSICPVLGIHFLLSLVSIVAIGLFLFFSRSLAIDALGVLFAPCALSALFATELLQSSPEVIWGLQSKLLPIHIGANILGLSFLLMSAVSALVYLFQERRLKKKNFSPIFRKLPPTESLEKAQHFFLKYSFPWLTLAVFIGTLWAHQIEKAEASSRLRAFLGYALWGLCGGILLLNNVWAWRGRKASYGILASFALSMILVLFYLFRGESA